MDKTIEIWTDGACSGNPGKGGCAAVLKSPDEGMVVTTNSENNSTNQRMEIMAVIMGFKHLSWYHKDFNKVLIYSDSAYVCNCVNQKWYVNWRDNNWVNSKKQPVANRELWEEMFRLKEDIESKGIITEFVKVNGHSGNEMNELADKLAVLARKGEDTIVD